MRLHDILDSAATKRPDHPALVCGGQSANFAQLQAASRRLGGAIVTLTAPGDRVAILSEGSVAAAAALYGTSRAGVVQLPLNPRSHDAELIRVGQHAEPSVLLTSQTMADRAHQLAAAIPTIRQVVQLEAALSAPIPESDRPGAEEEPVWLLSTSGSTGTPKAVPLTHRNILSGLLSEALVWHVQPTDTFLLCFNLCQVGAYTVPLYHLFACTVVLLPTFTARGFLDAVQTHRVTSVSIAPTMISMVLDEPGQADADLTSLRFVIYGSAPFPASELRRAQARFGPVLAQGMGATELCGTAFYLDPTAHAQLLEAHTTLDGCVGSTKPLVDVCLLDPDGRPVPDGEVGEVGVRGEQVFSGYWRPDPATPSPFHDGWYRTGDLARVDAAGRYHVVGRTSDLVITGGANVHPREVEDVLDACPAVRESAVVGLPDDHWGELLAAAVALRDDTDDWTPERLRAWCRERLSRHKVPKRVVVLPELPRTPAGKIAKPAVREILADLGADGGGPA